MSSWVSSTIASSLLPSLLLVSSSLLGVWGSADSSTSLLTSDWVACFAHGRPSAEAFAASHHMRVTAEVVPDSLCFQLVHAAHSRREKREAVHATLTSGSMAEEADVTWAELQMPKVRVKRRAVLSPKWNDPMWTKMWYLHRATNDEPDMNVRAAWEDGLSGKGIAVTILDDGIEKDHPDLIANYDPLASTDINDNDSDPGPRYDGADSNRHGTRCAGQVAAVSNNSECAVGVAFHAQIGGIRMLDGQVTDAVEARALSFNPDHIDIYSSSWGPNDDGKTVDGPGKLALRAFKNGITRGRDGKGSIFVWASGNGGRFKDNCNCDGYATAIYTITVSSTSESGHIPWYSEACSSTMATTYSSGTVSEKQIVTTDLRHKCTTKHTGTSASAPMAAGIIALALEANPELTWRDVQHLIVRTSRPRNLKAPDWRENALGRRVSHAYGYGLMDATGMARLARAWNLVPKQQKCEVSSPYYFKVIPAMQAITVELEVKRCVGVKHLEHVVSPVHVSPGRKRGDLRIYLVSPSGTRSTLLDARPHDYSNSAFIDWPFMSVHFWGENPTGKWMLEIHNDAYSKWAADAKFFKWGLTLYGTDHDPNDERDRDHDNVVRDVSRNHIEDDIDELETRPTAKLASNAAATATSKSSSPTANGCVSSSGECTQLVRECRTFAFRRVAKVMCVCDPECLGVGVDARRQRFNMQCHISRGRREETLHKHSLPFYCQFLPFLS